MSAEKFEVGGLYYELGRGDFGPIISSYVFLGLIQTPGKSSELCDVPEHFYVFQEWNSWWSQREFGDLHGSAHCVHIPSRRQASENMLTWEELVSAIDELSEHAD